MFDIHAVLGLPPGAWSCALHDFFFQAVSFLPHYMPKVHKLPLFNRRK